MSKKKTKSLEGDTADVNVDMTPLIDVTFLLIIFFMIISTFNEMERAAVKELPISQYQATVEPDVASDRMIVNIQEDGVISLYGQPYDIEGFENQLARYKPALQRVGTDTEKAPIILRGHKESRYEVIKQVLSAIYNEGFQKVMFAAYEAKADDEN